MYKMKRRPLGISHECFLSPYTQVINKSCWFYFQNVSQICPFLPMSMAHAVAYPPPHWRGTLQQPPNWFLHCNFCSSPAHSPQNSQSDRCCYSSLGNWSMSLPYFKSMNCFSLCLPQNQALHKVWPVYLSDPISSPFLPCVLCSPHWSFFCFIPSNNTKLFSASNLWTCSFF